MKVATVIARFLAAQGIRHVFGVNGGANLWMIHAIYDEKEIRFVPTTHECNAGFAADAYARLTGLGVAMATSGPGATNLVTAIATSYYDSVPVLFVVGNVATFRFGRALGVREYGFQEHDSVAMVRGFTKYADEPMTGADVIPSFERALSAMLDGRKGPALISIPDDVQRAMI